MLTNRRICVSLGWAGDDDGNQAGAIALVGGLIVLHGPIKLGPVAVDDGRALHADALARLLGDVADDDARLPALWLTRPELAPTALSIAAF